MTFITCFSLNNTGLPSIHHSNTQCPFIYLPRPPQALTRIRRWFPARCHRARVHGVSCKLLCSTQCSLLCYVPHHVCLLCQDLVCSRFWWGVLFSTCRLQVKESEGGRQRVRQAGRQAGRQEEQQERGGAAAMKCDPHAAGQKWRQWGIAASTNITTLPPLSPPSPTLYYHCAITVPPAPYYLYASTTVVLPALYYHCASTTVLPQLYNNCTTTHRRKRTCTSNDSLPRCC
jgi:hypothetical protein